MYGRSEAIVDSITQCVYVVGYLGVLLDREPAAGRVLTGLFHSHL